MSTDPTGTDNTPPALRLIVTADPEPTTPDLTGTQNGPPALRLVVTTDDT
ncbi:MAG TPA: hypothetical protein VFH45_09745 [Acidimicrobiales bacterium]|nr:hypothetical protein [Acidimicrobiales bacterium]